MRGNKQVWNNKKTKKKVWFPLKRVLKIRGWNPLSLFFSTHFPVPPYPIRLSLLAFCHPHLSAHGSLSPSPVLGRRPLAKQGFTS